MDDDQKYSIELIEAAKICDTDKMYELIKKGASISARIPGDPRSRSALFYAMSVSYEKTSALLNKLSDSKYKK